MKKMKLIYARNSVLLTLPMKILEVLQQQCIHQSVTCFLPLSCKVYCQLHLWMSQLRPMQESSALWAPKDSTPGSVSQQAPSTLDPPANRVIVSCGALWLSLWPSFWVIQWLKDLWLCSLSLSFVMAMARCSASAQRWIVCSTGGLCPATWCKSSLGGICGVLQNGLWPKTGMVRSWALRDHWDSSCCLLQSLWHSCMQTGMSGTEGVHQWGDYMLMEIKTTIK